MYNIEQFYKNSDRLINDENIENLAHKIYCTYGIDFRNQDHYMTFFSSSKFERLSNETKKEILSLALQMSFNFQHEILLTAKSLAMILNGSNMARYDLQDYLEKGIINSEGTDVDENGNISISSIQGNYSFQSVIKKFKNKTDILEYIFPIKITGHCFSNAIFLLEYFKKGQILFVQINNGFHTYLHSLYLDENGLIIDLNYLVSMNHSQFLELYKPNYVISINYELWNNLKSNANWSKKESVLVAYGLLQATNKSENNEYTQKEIINFLDQFNEFTGDKRLK